MLKDGIDDTFCFKESLVDLFTPSFSQSKHSFEEGMTPKGPAKQVICYSGSNVLYVVTCRRDLYWNSLARNIIFQTELYISKVKLSFSKKEVIVHLSHSILEVFETLMQS